MELVLTPDQEFFAETTAKYLEDKASPTDLRALRHDPAGFSPAYWRQGAELGWTSLLVSEDDGGGSMAVRSRVGQLRVSSPRWRLVWRTDCHGPSECSR